ncbi:MAG: hypothetical protein IPK50_18945 [Fibrobacterota bacterium]|nr:MAG: hypothetical protein IPK50_18945 [Fibrobacterota bacterium]
MSTAQPAIETTDNTSLAWKGPAKPAIHAIWESKDGGIAMPTFKLHVTAIQNLKVDQKLTWTLVDGSDPANPQMIDVFKARIARRGDHWFFSNLEDPRPADHPVKTGKHVFTDHVNFVLPGIDGAFTSILKPTPTLDPGMLYLKVHAGDTPVDVYATQRIIPRRYEYEKLSRFLQLGDELAHPRASKGARDVLFDKIPSPQLRDIENAKKELEEFEAYEKALKKLSEQMDEMSENPNTAFLVHLSQVRQYRKNIRELEEINKRFRELDSSTVQSAIFAPEYSWLWLKRKRLVKEAEEFKQEAWNFLDIDHGIPEEYRKKAKKGIARREEIQMLQNTLDHPLTKLICCLPLGGLVEGGLLILQGNYAKGILAAGFDVLTYGGLGKIANLPGLYQGVSALNREAVSSVFQWRYFAILKNLEEGGINVLKLGSKLAEANLPKLASPAFGMAASLLQLLGQVRDVRVLWDNRKVIKDAIRDLPSSAVTQAKFYKNMQTFNNTMMVFGGIRAIAIACQGGEAAVKALDALPMESKKIKAKETQNRVVAALNDIKNLLPPAEMGLWEVDVIQEIEKADSGWFIAGQGIFENWEAAHAAWVDELERLKNEERRKNFKPMEFNSPEKMRADLAKILDLWKKLEGMLVGWLSKHQMEVKQENYRQAYGSMGLKSVVHPLDLAMETFMQQVNEPLKFIYGDQVPVSHNLQSWYSALEVDEKKVDPRDPSIWVPRVYCVYSNFEIKALEAIEAIHGK